MPILSSRCIREMQEFSFKIMFSVTVSWKDFILFVQLCSWL